MFSGKNILVGVTGGIAAYKTCEIVRELIKNDATVKVVMTDAAKQFVTPLTFETLTASPVRSDLFEKSTLHIELARWAHGIVVCPATANTINKIAIGIADNLLTTLILAANVPVVFCPAMNKEMHANPIYQANCFKLAGLGYHFIESGQGQLACGEEGWGRLADKQVILDSLRKILTGTNELNGKKIVVSAGRTEEPLDPVRILTNYSSGKMGFALAEAAVLMGADVTLIAGPNQLPVFTGIKYVPVKTTQQMAEAVFKEFDTADAVIMAAAVADFRPKNFSQSKIKKSSDTIVLELEKTTDILSELGKRKGNKKLVGFALETEQELENARLKLNTKNLDMIVLNNPLKEGAAIGGDTNRVTILSTDGESSELPIMNKIQVAFYILNRLSKIL
jgi:phosphopantothenoylcysteine decarboxylase / phosphopantothenate---cysteine ligase